MTAHCKHCMIVLPPAANKLLISVNEVFDPERVDTFYRLSEGAQQETIRSHRATNYSVIRPELLDRLYESMYHQRLHEPNKDRWKYQIATSRGLVGGERDLDGRIRLSFRDMSTGEVGMSPSSFDFIIVATGYVRNAHERMLEPTRNLLQSASFDVERNYRVKYREDKVAHNSGIWLQGCCEGTHGVSSADCRTRITLANYHVTVKRYPPLNSSC